MWKVVTNTSVLLILLAECFFVTSWCNQGDCVSALPSHAIKFCACVCVCMRMRVCVIEFMNFSEWMNACMNTTE